MIRTLILAASLLLGAAVPFTERTKTDFDTFLQLLNPYGKWVKTETAWLYEPFDPYVPMTEGRWIYTDFGWYWQGHRPFSWATDHYGVWRLGQDNVWRWKPDGNWQPAKVEWRGTPAMIGWRPTASNRFGEITESEETRYARPAEWIFLPREKLTGTFMATDVTTGEAAKPLLEPSEAVNHTFVSWRELDRLGPDPYDVYGVAKSFLAQQTMPEPQTINLGGGEDGSSIIVAAPTATPSAGGAAGTDSEKDKKPPIYVIMSLPNFWFEVKPNPLKPLELYIYRPEIFQDAEGIQRRVDVWHNPPARKANREKVTRVLEHGTLIIDGKTPPAPPESTDSTPVTAPVPAPATATSSTPAVKPAAVKETPAPVNKPTSVPARSKN